jgi:hypothetical protein
MMIVIGVLQRHIVMLYLCDDGLTGDFQKLKSLKQ